MISSYKESLSFGDSVPAECREKISNEIIRDLNFAEQWELQAFQQDKNADSAEEANAIAGKINGSFLFVGDIGLVNSLAIAQAMQAPEECASSFDGFKQELIREREAMFCQFPGEWENGSETKAMQGAEKECRNIWEEYRARAKKPV